MSERVLQKARAALDRYVYLMTQNTHAIQIWVSPEKFDVSDPELDDAYKIEVKNAEGNIWASNPRAALIAVYHFLRENGCVFVRPGAASERIPLRAAHTLHAKLQVKAAHRFRGICIEGSCNLENTLDLLEWMPKVGLNCYFMQFREGYHFFQRWYECTANSAMTPWTFNLEICRDIVRKISAAAHENGLLYHAAGHGFTCECYGVPGLGWQPYAWPEDKRSVLAERNGVRTLNREIPLISALCYSDSSVQECLTDEVVRYAQAHPEVDFVHFWLDDGMNNKCECERCRGERVADSYIRMLNLLDQKLSARNLDTKIVFLSYYELLWPPQRERLNHSKRFIFMFAPIERSFLEPLPSVEDAGELPPYVLNDQHFPHNNAQMIAFLKTWNEYRSSNQIPLANSFDYDYYCSDYNDPGQFIQAQIVYTDVKSLHKNGLGGIINCQAQRSFACAGFPLYVMARALVQPELSFETLTEEFFYGAFGENAEAYRERWKELTAFSAVLRGSKEPDAFQTLLLKLEKPLPNIVCKDVTTSHSCKLMEFLLQIYLYITKIMQYKEMNEMDKARYVCYELDQFTSEKECEYAQEFDRQYLKEIEKKMMESEISA